MLRCATWLAPGLPLDLFTTVTSAVAEALDTEATLESHTYASGPDPDDDPFARGEIDLGFVCAPSYRQLTSVRLVHAAPVFDDERNGGRPVYFAELVARDATSLSDLQGTRIGYNDESSMSGFTALRERMRELGLDDSVATLVRTGSHRASLQQLADGDIDAASIDSNTLRRLEALPLGCRVIETWGPLPVQPVVARATLTDKTRTVIAEALLSLHEDAQTAARLRACGVLHFAPVTEDDYR
jgi:ABC-type phosphate/phosphonate transport system substrate-binding protein